MTSPLMLGTDIGSPNNRLHALDLIHNPEMTKSGGISFGTGSRPPLMVPTSTPGPGAYPFKSTLGKSVVAGIESPPQFTLRSRQKFGDPYARANSKQSASEPGPGQYNLNDKFLYGSNPEKYSFPKNPPPSIKAQLAPGPGAYQPVSGLGKQVLSTKQGCELTVFPYAARGSLVLEGASDVGPGEYKPPPAACEPQIDSRKVTCPTVKFGTGYQKGNKKPMKVDLNEPAPGPGAYTLPGGLGTHSSAFHNAPKASLSGRNSFGSPW